jgi:AraC-like DNA-binding protein
MPKPIRSTAAARERFLRALAPERAYHVLLDHLPGIAFFAKDSASRLMAANRQFFERFGFRKESQIVGKTDFDLFPARLAEHFRRDDVEVTKSAKPKLNIVELFFDRQGIPDWFITHKFPVFDRKGRVIGLMGVTQSYAVAKEALQPYLAIDRAVTCIRERFREKLTVPQLAAYVHLSPRQLHRKFVETFGSSPQAFILKVRIQSACELLQHGDRAMSEVAREAGFTDQSAFTQHFRRHIGVTPREYQQRFRLVRR